MSRDHVTLIEVGLRDGLQNEATPVSAQQRAHWFNQLAAAGLPRIEAGSFVSPRWVPQMADTDQVIAAIERRGGTQVEVLVPNQRGLESALAAGVDRIALFTAASDAFTQKNINCTVSESIARFRPLVSAAREAGIPVRGYVSTIVGCPYAGAITPKAVAGVCEQLLAMGIDDISLGDTIGVARPLEIDRVLDAVLPLMPAERLALHCHDTYGQALANVLQGLQRGIRSFDSAVAGLGGCPYAKGASGNLATEDLLYLLAGQGLHTGVDPQAVQAVGEDICRVLKRNTPSKVAQAVQAANRPT
ncbi:MAG: hydroxymethylglutaryl-CoA lyase [Halomonadaceae bacterium]|nr:MAG: hydroxymethylglutaryl-CoA lyase [Halomonadaceae bacterium]